LQGLFCLELLRRLLLKYIAIRKKADALDVHFAVEATAKFQTRPAKLDCKTISKRIMNFHSTANLLDRVQGEKIQKSDSVCILQFFEVFPLATPY
jgi:hypothetical protein